MRALKGENAKRLVFLEFKQSDINGNGEFVDPWRTPYEVFVSEKGRIIVVSAGPNGHFDSNPATDDIVRAWPEDQSRDGNRN